MSQRQTVTTLLESEHRIIDEGFGVFRSGLATGVVAPSRFDEAARALRRHIFIEEELLFPELDARSFSGPIVVMVQEHGEIWRLLDVIQRRLEKGNYDVAALTDDIDALHNLLEAHDLKEEHVLYPTADELLGDQERLELLHALLEVNLPEGWICKARRVPSS